MKGHVTILGIHNGHNAGAALLRDGLVIATINEFGFEARTGFRDGLRKTIEWYAENCRQRKSAEQNGKIFFPTPTNKA